MLSRYLRKDGSYWFEADYKEIDKSEVVRLLGEFGINPDNLLIIMHQGMIEELGAVTPQERLKMVEEAVGFSEFRERILLAEQELSGLIGEESSLLQLIDNANQALEYWKQIYDRYLEKKKLSEHRFLLEKELLWSMEAKLSKSLQPFEEKIMGKTRTLEDLKEQQTQVGADGDKTHSSLLDKQVELTNSITPWSARRPKRRRTKLTARAEERWRRIFSGLRKHDRRTPLRRHRQEGKALQGHG